MSEHNNDFCNCPDCPFFNADFPHYCGLGQAMKVHAASVQDAVENCHCVNPALLELFVKLGDGGMNEVYAPIGEVITLRPQVPQTAIDEALRVGANDPSSRLRFGALHGGIGGAAIP